jgi:predicted adenine nucleotide alpha hydrolase (AANH) superfamily ATPase
MPNRRNYQKELEAAIKNIKENEFPRLLLHSCCAPCSSYCMEYLSEFFDITVFYFDPNIAPLEEYLFRVSEQKRLIAEMKLKRPVSFIEGQYDPELFYEAARGLEGEPEGGKRCEKCFELRLRETAALAKKEKFDYFTTTLSISPLKSAEKLNNIGEKIADEYGIKFLNSDFKKRGGYQRSIELSKEYGLYRQDYCGCVYSKNEADRRRCLIREE